MAETRMDELRRVLRERIERGEGSPLPQDDYDMNSWNHVGSFVNAEGQTVDRYERRDGSIQGIIEVPRGIAYPSSRSTRPG